MLRSMVALTTFCVFLLGVQQICLNWPRVLKLAVWKRNQAQSLCVDSLQLEMQKIDQIQGVHIEFSDKRIGVLTCLPNTFQYLMEFGTFLFASWNFSVEHRYEMMLVNFTQNVVNPVDLLVFCHVQVCKWLPKQCVPFEEGSFRREPTCYYLETEDFSDRYVYLNSYCFLSHNQTSLLPRYYTYLMRTDMDVFLTPTLLIWTPSVNIFTGKGGYTVEFTRNRLRYVAKRYGLRHQGVHDLGSTWFGDSSLVLELSQLSRNLSERIYDTEFNETIFPEIAIYMNHTSNGKWPEWYRLVSTMYGQELALNHVVDGISKTNVAYEVLDGSSCSETYVLSHAHVHAWHVPCEFQKWNFLSPLVANITYHQEVVIPQRYKFERLASCMNTREYCMYIAWNSLVRYPEWITSAIGFFDQFLTTASSTPHDMKLP